MVEYHNGRFEYEYHLCVKDKGIWRLHPTKQGDITVRIFGKLDVDQSSSRGDV